MGEFGQGRRVEKTHQTLCLKISIEEDVRHIPSQHFTDHNFCLARSLSDTIEPPLMPDLQSDVVESWLGNNMPPDITTHCATRDIFQVRLDSFLRLFCEQNKKTSEISLLVAIAGEVGNNCFDHNLGQWIDVPGCWFGYDRGPTFVNIALADRGQGILSSLKTVEPTLQDEQQAIELAFSRAVSGRSPERRGNGLKFVRSVVDANPKRGLFCQSGSGIMSLGGLANDVQKEVSLKIGKNTARGTLTFMRWASS